MTLGQTNIGDVVMLEWNREVVKLGHKSSCRAIVKPLFGGGESEVSLACEVLPHDGQPPVKANKKPSTAMTDLSAPIRTIKDLCLWVVRLRFEKGLSDKEREQISRLARCYGLLEADSLRPTSTYFALVDDDIEKLCRELTGQTKQAPGLCACGCGRMIRGRAKTATAACRKRLSRQIIRDVTEKPVLTAVCA